MRKHLGFLLSLAFAIPAPAKNPAPTFRVELRCAKAEVVLGEPIACEEIFWHPPLKPQGAMDWDAVHVEGPVRPGCKTERRLVEVGMRIGEPEPGPAEYRRSFFLSDCGIVDEGEYEIWTEYRGDLPVPNVDSSGFPPVVSNKVRVKLVRPSGVDAQAFNSLHDDCNRLVLAPEQILTRFPTSTYAGYVLAKKVRDLSDWRLKVAPAEKFVEDARKRPHLFRECKEEVEFFSLLEQHIEGGHVPGGLASQLYGFYGEQLLLRSRETEALAAFQKATCEEPQDAKGKAYYLRSLAFLKALGEERPPTGRSAP